MLRILVVEDEPTIATGLKDNLEVEGYAIEVVDDGGVALDRILEGPFDLVVLDVENVDRWLSQVGRNAVRMVLKKGRVVFERPEA